MPLQDRFGKKITKPQSDAPKPGRGKHLSHVPTMDDLMDCLIQAQENVRQPQVMSWKANGKGPVYLMTVIRNTEDSEPTWMMHVDEKNEMTVLWSYSTSDPGLILNLISDQDKDNNTKAEIPENLRPQPTPDSQPQFFENYEIIDTIGHGGMGIIYKAKDRSDGNYVALKVLRADLMVDPSNVQRFKHEASAVRSLKHPNLIGLREFGVSRFGQPFLAMDYLEGVELRTLLDHVGRLDPPTFVNIFTQICEALYYAHEQGLVHRDLKPGNIMLVKTKEGKDTVKIIDFGIAKSVREQPGTASSITTYGHFLGSPAYMSPEQCGGAVLDSRSDIYSLGCVMYEAITGVLPFKYDNVLKVIMAHVNDPPPSFAIACPDVEIPRTLEDIIFTAMRKNPNDRYQSARGLAEDLWEFAACGSATFAATSISQQVRAMTPDQAAQILSDAGHEVQGAAVGAKAPVVQKSPEQVAQMQPAARTATNPRTVETSSEPIQQQMQSGANIPASQAGIPPRTNANMRASKPHIPHQSSMVRLSRTIEHNPLSDMAFTLLRRSNVLTDDILQVVKDCVQALENGDISLDQAVQVIKHACNKRID